MDPLTLATQGNMLKQIGLGGSSSRDKPKRKAKGKVGHRFVLFCFFCCVSDKNIDCFVLCDRYLANTTD